MEVKEAISVFKKKYPSYKVFGYEKISQGIVLGAESGRGKLECCYYLVKPTGAIEPTHPMLIDLDFDKFQKI